MLKFSSLGCGVALSCLEVLFEDGVASDLCCGCMWMGREKEKGVLRPQDSQVYPMPWGRDQDLGGAGLQIPFPSKYPLKSCRFVCFFFYIEGFYRDLLFHLKLDKNSIELKTIRDPLEFNAENY